MMTSYHYINGVLSWHCRMHMYTPNQHVAYYKSIINGFHSPYNKCRSCGIISWFINLTIIRWTYFVWPYVYAYITCNSNIYAYLMNIRTCMSIKHTIIHAIQLHIYILHSYTWYDMILIIIVILYKYVLPNVNSTSFPAITYYFGEKYNVFWYIIIFGKVFF